MGPVTAPAPTTAARAALPPTMTRLLIGLALSSLGTGLTLPFTLILLHEVRGIALQMTGLLLAVPAVVGLAAVPVSGALVDRVGPRPVLRVALLLQAIAQALLAVAGTPLTVLPAMVLLGLGLGPSFPAFSALLSGLVPEPAAQARAYGLQFTVLNACIGLGGLTAAAVVDVSRPLTFEVLYAVNALTCLLYAACLPRTSPSPPEDQPDAAGRPSYREVLADPAFRRVCLVALLCAFTGYAALEGGLPAYARAVGHVPPSVIALAFAVNTAVTVAGQTLVVRLLRGRRRSRALAGSAALWAVSWGVLLLVPGESSTGRTTVVLVFSGLFGLGEMLPRRLSARSSTPWQPTVCGVATTRCPARPSRSRSWCPGRVGRAGRRRAGGRMAAAGGAGLLRQRGGSPPAAPQADRPAGRSDGAGQRRTARRRNRAGHLRISAPIGSARG